MTVAARASRGWFDTEPTENDPLLDRAVPTTALRSPLDGAALHRGEDNANHAEAFDAVPQKKRKLGLFSAAFLIFNRVIGTGIYATPSVILRSAGSVGMSLVMWVVAACVAAAGTAIYVELGTGLPRNGGEKNYLEFIYRRPKFLVTCVYTMFAVFMGWSAANSVIIGEYVLHAFSVPTTRFNTRIVGLFVLTAAFLLHGTRLTWGLRLQNILGVFKLLLLLSFALAGALVALNAPGFRVDPAHRPHNFKRGEVWAGTHLQVNALVTCLYTVIWSFIGYSNANYALSEVRDPVRTIKRAAPLAMGAVFLVYALVNVAYLTVVTKEDIIGGGRVVAALFFRNLFGPATEKALSILIALSTFGNVLAVMFSQGRVVQELGREGVLPHSAFFASNAPYDAPLAGMFWQWLISAIVMFAPPPGDAFNFILSLMSYPLALINAAIAAGVLFLRTPAGQSYEWAPPFRTPTPVVTFFLFSNAFLLAAPLVPPAPGLAVFEHLPYWLHMVVALGIGLLGGVYWYVWAVWQPRCGGYALVREPVLQADGVSRSVFKKVALG